MWTHRSFPAPIIKSITGAMLFGTLTPLPAHADDPLQTIRQTIQADRQRACPNSGILSGDQKLEDIAQAYARDEKQPTTPPPGYHILLPFLGAGDPEAQAINRAYQHGAGGVVGICNEFAFGVGFIRHDDRSVDVVTIVFGVLNQPNHPAAINLRPGSPGFFISGSGFSQNSTVSISYNYSPPGGGNLTGNYGAPTTLHVDQGGNFTDIIGISTYQGHGTLNVSVTDTGGLSTTKTIQF